MCSSEEYLLQSTPAFSVFHQISVFDFTAFLGRRVHKRHFFTVFPSSLQPTLCKKVSIYPIFVPNVTGLGHTFHLGAFSFWSSPNTCNLLVLPSLVGQPHDGSPLTGPFYLLS